MEEDCDEQTEEGRDEGRADDGDARPGTDRHLSEDWTAGVLDGPIHTAIDT